jgi:hypothetical protein
VYDQAVAVTQNGLQSTPVEFLTSFTVMSPLLVAGL